MYAEKAAAHFPLSKVLQRALKWPLQPIHGVMQPPYFGMGIKKLPTNIGNRCWLLSVFFF